MLELVITTKDGFDPDTNRFVDVETVAIQLEHSLLSLSKWESIWEKPFLKDTDKLSPEEYFDYIRCMLLDEEDEKYLNHLTPKNVETIQEYINSKQSAAWFNDKATQRPPGGRGKIITADLIYYWMVAMQIPFQCETWHLQRLLTLIRITEIENRPKKNMNRKDSMSQHRSLNAKRRAGMG